ncbi:MAG: SLC13 family permease [Sphingomonadales bacterium]
MSSNELVVGSNNERAGYQNIGLYLGPMIFLLMVIFGKNQEMMGTSAWATAAVGLWMAVWWATEAIPVPVTAFLPLVVFAPLGISTLSEASAPFANKIIYLYLGGFMMALAVERWNLHKRIALSILSNTGTEGKKLIGGFMLTTALLSMFMTNTSTTMMLLPIAISIVAVIKDNVDGISPETKKNFQTAMLLGLAYSATIGGLATLVGTPPNALLAAYLNENYGMEITFVSWMAVGVPMTAIMLPLAWLVLTKYIFPINIPASIEAHDHLIKLKAGMGPMTKAEKRVALIFGLVIFSWILRRPLQSWFGLPSLDDTGIVMTGALFLFLAPSGDKSQRTLMVWESVSKLPWGVLILFGGGLSLAMAVSSTGLAQFMGENLAPLNVFGMAVLVVGAATLVIFLTELTSNVATTATFLPVMGAMAFEAGVSPLILCVPITIAASCAFMLPVATPPNAIVFASNLVTIPQMVKAGATLNLIGIILIGIISIWWAPIMLP